MLALTTAWWFAASTIYYYTTFIYLGFNSSSWDSVISKIIYLLTYENLYLLTYDTKQQFDWFPSLCFLCHGFQHYSCTSLCSGSHYNMTIIQNSFSHHFRQNVSLNVIRTLQSNLLVSFDCLASFNKACLTYQGYFHKIEKAQKLLSPLIMMHK